MNIITEINSDNLRAIETIYIPLLAGDIATLKNQLGQPLVSTEEVFGMRPIEAIFLKKELEHQKQQSEMLADEGASEWWREQEARFEFFREIVDQVLEGGGNHETINN